MRKFITMLLAACTATIAWAQDAPAANNFWNPSPRNYEATRAFEVESLFPMFISGGFHVGVGYRINKFRIRASIINGGSYNAEEAGVNNSSDEFERHYKTSPGVFFGYNIWKNLELYSYLEFHTFEIEQKSTGAKQDIFTTDTGIGISYQFFVGRNLYLQPGFHTYFRSDHSVNFGSQRYSIPNVDLSPVIRIGYRFWSKY